MTSLLTLTVVLSGLATYYVPAEGSIFRNGEPATLDASIAAVDVSEWPVLEASWLLVCSHFGCGYFQISDTGRLYGAGRFSACKWRPGYCRSEEGHSIVLDFPIETFKRLSPNLETVEVWAWRWESPIGQGR